MLISARTAWIEIQLEVLAYKLSTFQSVINSARNPKEWAKLHRRKAKADRQTITTPSTETAAAQTRTMLTRLIVRGRLRSAKKYREWIREQIIDRVQQLKTIRPESLHGELIRREIDDLLVPQLDHTEQLIHELEDWLRRS